MSIAAEVASKPGGEALARHLRKVEHSRPEEIRQVGERWRNAAKAAESAGAEIAHAVRGVDGAWNGQSADAFVGYMGKLTGGFRKASDAVEGSANALDRAAEAVESAKTALNSIGERALADAKEAEDAYAKAVKKHADDDEAVQQAAQVRDDAIERAMGQHAQEARGKIDEANERLNSALGALKQSSGELEGVFSELPEAGEQNFTPAPGRRIDWEAVPPKPEQPAPNDTAGSVASPAESSGSVASPAESSGAVAEGSAGSSSSGGDVSSTSGGASGGLGPSGGPPSSGPPPGNVDQWIREAIRILRANGIPVTEENIDEIWTIIEHESGGDPHAINNWDSNAAKGTPSKGLMQCIDPTFESYKLPGHDDIYDPVDNIIAGVRYTFDRYGGFEGHPGLQSMESGGGYQGY